MHRISQISIPTTYMPCGRCSLARSTKEQNCGKTFCMEKEIGYARWLTRSVCVLLSSKSDVSILRFAFFFWLMLLVRYAVSLDRCVFYALVRCTISFGGVCSAHHIFMLFRISTLAAYFTVVISSRCTQHFIAAYCRFIHVYAIFFFFAKWSVGCAVACVEKTVMLVYGVHDKQN